MTIEETLSIYLEKFVTAKGYPKKEEFLEWHRKKIESYIEYIQKVKPIQPSKEIENKLFLFELSSIPKRYELFIQSKLNEK